MIPLSPTRTAPDEAGVPWNERDVVIGMVAAVALVAAAAALLAVYGPERIDISVLAGPMELLLIVPVAWLTLHKYHARWQTLGFRSFPVQAIVLGAALFAGIYVFNFAYGSLLALFGLSAQGELLLELAETTSPPLVLLGVGVLAPFAEEVFFRGFLYAGLERRLGPSRSGWVSALLFALAHTSPLAMPPVFLMGLAFVHLFRRYRSIWPSIALHVANNVFAFIVMLLAARLGGIGV
jgi:membrane protease YdiL (CAAX protease family)